MKVSKFEDFFTIYDWLKQWAKEIQIPPEMSGYQQFMGSLVGIQSVYGIPVLYWQKAEKRIRSVMIGWPVGEEEGVSTLDVKSKTFLIRHIYVSEKSGSTGISGFGEDILMTWPNVEEISILGNDGNVKRLWEKAQAVTHA